MFQMAVRCSNLIRCFIQDNYLTPSVTDAKECLQLIVRVEQPPGTIIVDGKHNASVTFLLLVILITRLLSSDTDLQSFLSCGIYLQKTKTNKQTTTNGNNVARPPPLPLTTTIELNQYKLI